MAKKKALDDISILEFETHDAWAAWLEANHASSAGVWLRIARAKAENLKTLSYGEALEAAICYGWIDAQKGGESETAWLQRFTPRGKKSIWSKINTKKALTLIVDGRMKAAGLREVERARADGRWEAAYDSPSAATVPNDLKAALNRDARARAFFRTLDSANRYAILFRLQTAKRPETRAKRLQQFLEMLGRNEKLHP
jgi:uncharacterized protein YdeI (YjbR/CyaY-like superfamily)